MRLRSNQLFQHLKQGLQKVYWVSGDDVLLNQETVDLLRQTARDQGFDEREIIDSEGGVDWNSLYSANQSMSLFGGRKIIELRLEKKPDAAGQNALIDYCQHASEDNLLIISSPRLDAATFKTKWYGKIDNQCIAIQIWPLERNQLPAWLEQRAKQAGLSIDREAVALLVDRVEGNLLAAKQELDKLALNSEDGHITAKTVVSSVADSSRYSIFDMGDPLLMGDYGRVNRICHSLQSEGVDMPILLWHIARELRLLHQVLTAIEQGKSPQQVLKSLRVLDKRHPSFQRASQRLSVADVEHCLSLVAKLDLASKGSSIYSKELLLQQLLAAVCKMPINASLAN